MSDALILYLFQPGVKFLMPSGRFSLKSLKGFPVSAVEAQLNGYNISEDDIIFLLLTLNYAMQAIYTFIPL